MSDGHSETSRPSDEAGDLIGRDRELAILARLLEASRAGRARVAVVAAAPGLGKTALLGACAARAVDRGARVLAGRAWPLDDGLAFAPLLDAIGPTLDREPDLADGLPDLAQLFPHLGLTAYPSLSDPALARTRLFASVARLLGRIAERGPTLLTLDDLHAADPSSVAMLSWLLRRCDSLPLVTVIAVRPEEVPGPLDALLQTLERAGATRLTPGPLRGTDLDALLRRRLGGPVAEALVATVAARTRGTPLFAEALVTALRQDGAIAPIDGTWHEVRRVADALPPAVDALFLARRARLDGPQRAVLDALAVAGEPAGPTLLEAIGLKDRLGEALAGLVEAGWVTETTRDGEPAWYIRHPLAAESALRAVPTLERRRLHLAAAGALRATGPTPELARHLLGAGAAIEAPMPAIDALTTAAADARERCAFDQEARWLSAALSLARHHGHTDRIPGILQRLGRAWIDAGEVPAGLAAWQEALPRLGADDAVEVRAQLAWQLWDRGQREEARGVLEPALRVEASPAALGAAWMVALLFAARTGSSDLEVASARLVALGPGAGLPYHLGSLTRAGPTPGVLHGLERTLASAAPDDRHRALASLVPSIVQREPEAGTWLQAYEDAVARVGLDGVDPGPPRWGGYLLLLRGAVDRAATQLQSAFVLATRLGSSRRQAAAAGLLGAARLYQGRREDARRWLVRVERGGFEGDLHVQTGRWILGMLLALDEGDAPAIDAACGRLCAADGVIPLTLAARGHLARGRPQEVQRLADRMETLELPWPRAQAAALRALAQGDAQALLACAESLDAVGVPLLAAEARLAAARMAPGKATAALQAVLARLEGSGCELLLAQARGLRRPGGRRAARSRGTPLSARELEVAQLAAKGLNSTEIGGVLFISPHTVQTHIKRIYARLEVSSRAELTRWVLEHDLLDAPAR